MAAFVGQVSCSLGSLPGQSSDWWQLISNRVKDLQKERSFLVESWPNPTPSDTAHTPWNGAPSVSGLCLLCQPNILICSSWLLLISNISTARLSVFTACQTLAQCWSYTKLFNPCEVKFTRRKLKPRKTKKFAPDHTVNKHGDQNSKPGNPVSTPCSSQWCSTLWSLLTS